ncbi:MAG: mechanosensitive ion channel family protein [Thermoleophilia bacterium]
MGDLIDAVNARLPVGPPAGRLLVIAALFLTAWAVSRSAGWLAARLVARGDRRDAARRGRSDTLMDLKQRETAISLLRTTASYAAFGVAGILSVAAMVGAERRDTVIGASFAALVVAFAAQRFLADVIAGLLMLFERWFRVGDAIRIEPWGVEGVVEEISLRTTVLRGAGGELVRIVNSELKAAALLPRGFREYEVELYASDEDAGRAAIESAGALAPVGPTQFVDRPRIVGADHLGDALVRLRARVAVAPGREGLARDLLPALIRERAQTGAILHGPVVEAVDDEATRKFGRALDGRPPRPR